MFPRLQKGDRYWHIVVKKNIVITTYGIKKSITKERTFPGYSTSGRSNATLPMKATLFNEDKIRFPAYVQPKLDGFRGIAVKGKIYSKKGLPYPHLQHIKVPREYILDGELYIHQEPIGSLKRVLGRKSINSPEIKEIQRKIKYYVFDVITDKPFEERYKILKGLDINLVPTTKIHTLQELYNLKDYYMKNGYEGIIVRNKDGLYKQGKVSQNVLRTKDFSKGIFKIVGANRAEDGAVIWVLECLKSKKTFTANPMGSIAKRKEMYKNWKKYIGKKLEVKYFELTSNGCVSRHPIGIKIIT
jgi:ATP-dependent DNA ligase